MKKLIVLILACLPLLCAAQSNKELTPEQKLEQAQKQLEEAQKAVAEAKANAEKARKAAEEAKAKALAEQAAKEKAAKEAKAKELAEKQAKIQEQIKKAQEEAAKLNAEAERLNAETEKLNNGTVKSEDSPSVSTSSSTSKKTSSAKVSESNKVVEVPVTEANETPLQGANGWSKPTSTTKKATKKTKKKKGNDDDDEDISEYLAGAVPMKDGNVVFTLDEDVPGKSAQEIYDIAYKYIEGLTQDENQKTDDPTPSMIVLVNKKDHLIAARMTEWLVFRSNFISLDRTEFNYTLIANCTDGHINMTMERLGYLYDEGQKEIEKKPAEEVITDDVALKKSKDKLAYYYGKFRRTTIDRKNEVFDGMRKALK